MKFSHLKLMLPFEIVVLLLFCSAICYPHQNPLHFEKEKIRIIIKGVECNVKGDYYFRNTTGEQVRAIITYPVAVNDSLPAPHFIRVTDVHGGDEVPTEQLSTSYIFEITVPPYSVRTYRIEYRQRTPFKKFEYILTTTAFWNRPLQSADVLISLPRDFALKFLSFPYDTTEETGGNTIFHLHRDNFLPTKNLVIIWENHHVK